MTWGQLARVKHQSTQSQVLAFNGFPHGLNSYEPADRIAVTELSELINWMVIKGGRLVTRSALTQYSTVAADSNATIKTIVKVNIGGTGYMLLVDSNYKLYYLDSDPKPVAIGTLEGDATILSYNGAAVIFDGSYIKYLDGVSSIKIAYDAGTGLSGFQFDNSAATNASELRLGNGTNSRVAYKFTTQAWTAGYTIPPVTISAYLLKVLAPTGDITARIRKVSDDAIMAAKVFVNCADVGDSEAGEYSITFASTDISVQLSPGIDYYASLEYAGGDAANYISVRTATVSSGGKGYYYAAATWTNDSAKSPLMSLSPGRPPKAKYGAVWKNRIFAAGDPDNPGYCWYGNLTYLDWSTADGGGYLGIIDDNRYNFQIGAMQPLYGDLYFFGTQNQPFLVKLSGNDPTDFAQSHLFQKPWATHKTLVSAVNDLWYANSEGIAPLSGVQEYGDVRTYFASDPVLNRITSYWSTLTALSGYYPTDGQYWFIMPTHHRVLICHTKIAVQSPDEIGTRYPWSEFEFFRHNLSSSIYKWTKSGNGTNEYYLELAAGGDPSIVVHPDFITLDSKKVTEGTAGSLNDHQWDYGDNDTLGYSTVYIRDDSGDPDLTGVSIRSVLLPTALEYDGSSFLIGGSDGFVYKYNPSDYKDMSTISIKPVLQTAYMEIPFTHANFHAMQIMASSIGGGVIKTSFYADTRFLTAIATNTTTFGYKDDLTVDELIMDVEDWIYPVDMRTTDPLFDYINFNARSVLIKMDDITIAGYPIYINGILLKYRGLSN